MACEPRVGPSCRLSVARCNRAVVACGSPSVAWGRSAGRGACALRHVCDRELITGLLSVRLKYCQGHGTCCPKSRVAHGDRDFKQYQRGECVGAAPSSIALHPRLWICNGGPDELSPCSWAGGVCGGREIHRGLCLGGRSCGEWGFWTTG